jgi:phenylpropionate dioxygenase-like ring-hydroxylating dioxygenase large terminal subunit
MFIRNAWYVAAWDHEVTRAPLARTLLGDPIVFFVSKKRRWWHWKTAAVIANIHS